MSTKTTASPPLKLEDLMERWDVSRDVVMEHIRKNGLPFWDADTGNGRRPLYRFRLADVEAWEAARRQVKTADGSAPSSVSSLASTSATPAPPLWDGKLRGNRGGSKSRGSKPART